MQGTAAHVRSANSLTDLKTSPKYSFELLSLSLSLSLSLLLFKSLSSQFININIRTGVTRKKCMGPVSLRLWIRFGLK